MMYIYYLYSMDQLYYYEALNNISGECLCHEKYEGTPKEKCEQFIKNHKNGIYLDPNEYIDKGFEIAYYYCIICDLAFRVPIDYHTSIIPIEICHKRNCDDEADKIDGILGFNMLSYNGKNLCYYKLNDEYLSLLLGDKIIVCDECCQRLEKK